MLHFQEVLPGEIRAFLIQYRCPWLNALCEAFSFTDSLVDKMADTINALFAKNFWIIAKCQNG